VRVGSRQLICKSALHMSHGIILSWSKGLGHTWHWISPGRGLPWGLAGDDVDAGGAEAWRLRKWDWTK